MRNNKPTYPKTYATIQKIYWRPEDISLWSWERPDGPYPIYVFLTDNGETIWANNPECRTEANFHGYKKTNRVKLFKIPTRNPNRWCYKYIGT